MSARIASVLNEVGTPEGAAAVHTIAPASTSNEPRTLVMVSSSRSSQCPRTRLVTSSTPTKMEPRMVKGPMLKPTTFIPAAMPYKTSPKNHAYLRLRRQQPSGTFWSSLRAFS